jgi:hypothetical protein
MKYLTHAMICTALFPVFAHATEYITESCYVFPEVQTKNIVNRRGDQETLRSDEAFTYLYAYQERQHIRLEKENKDGELDFDEFDRVKNETTNFRSDSVAAVRNLAEVFIRSHKPHECKKR